jgi:hypothetical protein
MRPGRRVDTFYLTLGGLTEACELAAAARQRLDEVTGTDLAAIIAAARDGLAALAPVTVTIGQSRVVGEGVICLVTPAGALDPARDAVRTAISDARGPDRVPDPIERARWSPHVSLAYANADGPAEPVEAALDGFTDMATVTVGAVDLIRFGRDRQMYEWETIARLPLGESPKLSANAESFFGDPVRMASAVVSGYDRGPARDRVRDLLSDAQD